MILKSLALPTLLWLLIIFVVGMEGRLIYSLSLSLRYSKSSSAIGISCFLDLVLLTSPFILFLPMLSCLRLRSLLFFLLSSVWKYLCSLLTVDGLDLLRLLVFFLMGLVRTSAMNSYKSSLRGSCDYSEP